MPVDRAAWEATRAGDARRRDREQTAASAIQRLRQVAVPMERLTGSEEWDSFLRHGEALQAADRSELEVVTAQLTSPGFISPDQLALMRHRVALLRVAIIARQEVLDLPRQILESVQRDTKINLDALSR